jgi:hypothetical protein
VSRRQARRSLEGNEGGGERLRGRLRACLGRDLLFGLFRPALWLPWLRWRVQHALDHRLGALGRLLLGELILIHQGKSSMASSSNTFSAGMEALIVDPKEPIPDEYTVRFGRFTFAWNQVESFLEEIIWMLAGIDPIAGRIFTNRQNTRYRLMIVGEFLDLHAAPDELLVKWSLIRKAAKTLEDTRNQLTHSVWAHCYGTVVLISSKRFDNVSGLVRGTDPLSTMDLDQYTAEAEDILWMLRAFEPLCRPHVSSRRKS